MNIGTILKLKFGREMLGHFIVQDDGKGAYISHWDEEAMGQKKPTATQLKKWEKEVSLMLKEQEAKKQKADDIIAVLGAEDKTDAIIKQINLIRKALEDDTAMTEFRKISSKIDKILSK